jgi:hypothetical protein
VNPEPALALALPLADIVGTQEFEVSGLVQYGLPDGEGGVHPHLAKYASPLELEVN